MRDPSEDILDDPELRRAIRRVRGGHVADDALRSRVAQLTAAPAPAGASPASRARSPRSAWRRGALRLAAAACLLFAGGVIEHVRHKGEERRNYAAANDGLLAAMVRSHAGPATSAAAADAHPVNDFADAQRVRDELSRRLTRRPPLPDLTPLGWTLRGAATHPLHGAVAARLAFAHGDRRATLFSLPKFALVGAADGSTYDVVIDGHPVSGYVTADGVHCVVGDRGAPRDEITALRKHLQSL